MNSLISSLKRRIKMDARQEILQSLRDAHSESFPKPELSALKASSLRYPDALEQFCKAVSASGGRTALLDPGTDPKVAAVQMFPGTEDLAVVEGVFGVAENGCVFLREPTECRRLDYFVHEALVIVLDRKEIVANMHDAYDRLGESAMHYGIFISGPSKTADIEQALVFGAHGAREVGVLLNVQ